MLELVVIQRLLHSVAFSLPVPYSNALQCRGDAEAPIALCNERAHDFALPMADSIEVIKSIT